ncbi:MAG: phosphatase [Opitutales bacterium]
MDLSFDLKTEGNAAVVGVIDIGSNSIKSLVAKRDADGFPAEIHNKTEETRLSGGISGNPPYICEDTILAGVDSIKHLLKDMKPYKPESIQLVATSAVRDAANRDQFAEAIFKKTGHALRVLSGEEEALGIAAGLQSDPAFRSETDLSVFDIGGGSLEHIDFQSGQIDHAVSTELGAVRMTQRFIANPKKPVVEAEIAAIREHTFKVLREADVSPKITGKAVGTGGGFTISRRILAKRIGKKTSQVSPIIGVAQLREIFDKLAPLSWSDRKAIKGLPKARADIYPAAAATLLALAEYLQVEEFYHSFYNLRFGVARLMMAGEPSETR